jgi:GWxTD domain-containing protein
MGNFPQEKDIPATSSGKLKFYTDYSAFKGKENKTYMEFYLMIHADELSFEGTGGRNASFKVSSVIKNRTDNLVYEQEWVTDALLKADSPELKTLVFYDKWVEFLNPGEYKISVSVAEQESKKSGIAEFDLIVPSFSDSTLSASSIEFISKVEENNGDNHFEKNGRIITPNPWRRYGLLIPKLSFYYEIYNIRNPDPGKFLLIDYSIIINGKEELKRIPDVGVKKSAENISVVHAVDIADFNSGVYTLKVEISDPETNQNSVISRQFEIIHADYLVNSLLLTEEELIAAGKILEYFATPSEYQLFETFSPAGKTKFLLNFWRGKDTSPDTPENEFLERIMERYHYANRHFRWGNSEGYRTDKGRILMKYGNPDEIESHSSESDLAPYEIWTYTKDKRFIFVFGDINSSGNFVLLHSTKENEVSNFNWKDYLRAF